jgi:hypothetical protein
MANLRQIPSLLRANDSAGSPRKKIEPSVKRTMWRLNLRGELGHLQAKRLAPRKGSNSRKRRSNPNRRQGILILNEIAPASVETPLKKLLAFLRA